MVRWDENGNTREQGVEFGNLTNRIINHNYPTTSTELIDEFGEHEVELLTGTQSLQDLFAPLQAERFDSPEDVHQMILNMVDERAIGRRYYSDRTPPVLGENTE